MSVTTNFILNTIQNFADDSPIDEQTDLFELNISSIDVSQVISQINRRFFLELTFLDFMNCDLIQDLVDLVKQKQQNIEVTTTYGHQIIPNDNQDTTNVTNVQMAYLTGRNEEFTLGGVSTHVYFEYKTDWNLERFEDIINLEIIRQPMLRAVFVDGKMKIKNSDECGYHLEVVQETDTDKNRSLEQKRAEKQYQNFDPTLWPLFNFTAIQSSDDTSTILFDIDALISDGFSIRILFEDLFKLYSNHQMNSISNVDLLTLIQNNSVSKSNDKGYWIKKIDQLPSAPELPYKVRVDSVSNPIFTGIHRLLPLDIWQNVLQLCKKQHVRPTFFLLACYANTLAKWGNQTNVLINCTLFDRDSRSFNSNTVIGDFTSVILTTYHRSSSIWKDIKQFQSDFLADYEHKSFDGIDVTKEILKHGDKPLTDIVAPVVFTSMLFTPSEEKISLSDVMNYSTQTPQVTLDHQAMITEEGLFLNWDYVTQLFTQSTIETMFNDYYNQIVNLAAAVVDIPIENKLVQNIYQRFNATEDLSVQGTSLLSGFTKIVKSSPENIAFEKGNIALTYQKLDQQSDQVALYLINQRNISKGDFVAIMGTREITALVGIIGILKSGAAYIPLSTEFPKSRIAKIQLDSNYKEMLDDAKIIEIVNMNGFNKLELPKLNATDIAYAIYTSGSTGNPKGVIITHGGATNTINDIIKKFHLNSSDVFLSISNLAFDLSVFDIFGSLTLGGKLVLCTNPRDMEEIWQLVTVKGITIWNSVPMLMEMFVRFSESQLFISDLDFSKLPEIRLVLLSGDWIPILLSNKIQEIIPECRVVSLGGATEASIWSIYYVIETIETDWTSIPYGSPLANQTYFVLDKLSGLCPIGVTGELYIGGSGLASGYLNNQEKTDTAFINHPVYGRIYKTGDIGYMTSAGTIIFKGRNDSQIKLNGFRIELGEIQNIILQLSDITSALVVSDTHVIDAYYVSDKGIPANTVSKYVSGYLPSYMMPKHFVQMDKIPLTRNGKVDKQALPKISSATGTASHQSIKPENEIEKFLAMTITNLLNVESVSTNTNFFDLGGNSLLIVELFNRVQAEYPNTIKLIDIFKNSTVIDLANVIRINQGKELLSK